MKTLKIKCNIKPFGVNQYDITTHIKGYLNKDVLVQVIESIIETGQNVYGSSFTRLVQREIGARHD